MRELLADDAGRSRLRLGSIRHAIDELEFDHLFLRAVSCVPFAAQILRDWGAKNLEALLVIVSHLAKELLPKVVWIQTRRKRRPAPIDGCALPQQINF